MKEEGCPLVEVTLLQLKNDRDVRADNNIRVGSDNNLPSGEIVQGTTCGTSVRGGGQHCGVARALRAGMEACDCTSGEGMRARASAVSCVGPVEQQSATRGHDMEQGARDHAEAGGSCEHKGEKGHACGASSLKGEKIAA